MARGLKVFPARDASGNRPGTRRLERGLLSEPSMAWALASARKPQASELLRNSVMAARAARVRYVISNEAGLRRQRVGQRFRYLSADGRRITDRKQLSRISLAIPPAWEQVWICRTPDGHIQATGVDARGRKQYRYHAAWRTVRDRAKYSEIVAFGHSLPRLRQRVARDLARRALVKDKVLAAIVALMQQTSIRVGNDEYATSNGSYRLTTLQDRHARIRGAHIALHFRGKAGKPQVAEVLDQRLATIVKSCRDIPGKRLFQYLNEHGRYRAITASDVNRYLREATGQAFTAKEFRTWQGTVRAAMHLLRCERGVSLAAGKRAIRAAVEAASAHLGNTAAICRKSYVHPIVLKAFWTGHCTPSSQRSWRVPGEEQIAACPSKSAPFWRGLDATIWSGRPSRGVHRRLSRGGESSGLDIARC
jgi:DNA topoisomerase-1